MLGAFKGEERSAGGELSYGELDAVAGLGGLAVISDYRQRVGGEAVFWGHGVYTYDAYSKQYVMTWFDSAGGGRSVNARGDFDGARLTFEADGAHGRSRYVYDVEEAGYAFTIETFAEGEGWRRFMEARYTRA